MLKKLTAPFSILMLLLLLPTQTTKADMGHFNWINPAYNGYDPYYGKNVIAYKEETPWNISLSVKNDYRRMPPPGIPEAVNITGIKVYFDWGEWYNWTFTPQIRMQIDEVKVFTVGNVTPAANEASEKWAHEFWVYVEYIPESSANVRTDWNWHETNFAIMSEDHFEALTLYNELNLTISDDSPLWYMVNITEAQVLMIESSIKFKEGVDYYSIGIFPAAQHNLEEADDLLSEALHVWNSTGTMLEEALKSLRNSEAQIRWSYGDAARKQADAALINSYAWLLFGIGWILIGTGAVIYSTKKLKSAKN